MKRIYLKEYGIHPGDERELVKKLDTFFTQHCIDDATLIFEPGIYHFYPDFAPSRMMYISNHDEDTIKKAAFLLENRHRVVLEGSGSSFIFHTELLPFYLADCEQITLQGFTVDYARPTFSEGIIRAITPQTIEIAIDPREYPWEVENETLYFVGENFREPMNLWLEMDAARGAPVYQTHDFYMDGFYGVKQPKAERVNAGIVHLTLTGEEHFLATSRPGNKLILRHHARTHPGFYLQDCKDILCKNIAVYSTEGIAFLAERTENILLCHFDVKIDPAHPRVFTATADATHFVNCYGKIEIANCLFENQLDDAVNIHGIYGVIGQRLDAHTLRVRLDHPMQKGVLLGHPGDVFAITERETLKPGKHLTLRQIRRINADELELIFAETLPATLVPNAVLENLTAKPDALIHHCAFRNNRARGLLLTCKSAEVTDCIFQTAGAALYMEGEAKYWFESGCTEKIVLRHNVFRNCAYVHDWGFAPIHVTPGVQKGPGPWYYHHRLVIESNIFECFDRRLVYARQVGQLSMEGNRVIKTTAFPPIEGKDVDIENFGHFKNTVYLEDEPSWKKQKAE